MQLAHPFFYQKLEARHAARQQQGRTGPAITLSPELADTAIDTLSLTRSRFRSRASVAIHIELQQRRSTGGPASVAPQQVQPMLTEFIKE